jgi:hypothetical protein
MNPETTPTLATGPALLGVLNALISRESMFHRPEMGHDEGSFRKHNDG